MSEPPNSPPSPYLQWLYEKSFMDEYSDLDLSDFEQPMPLAVDYSIATSPILRELYRGEGDAHADEPACKKIRLNDEGKLDTSKFGSSSKRFKLDLEDSTGKLDTTKVRSSSERFKLELDDSTVIMVSEGGVAYVVDGWSKSNENFVAHQKTNESVNEEVDVPTKVNSVSSPGVSSTDN